MAAELTPNPPADYLVKAARSLEVARLVIPTGHWDAIAGHVYYAALHAARGLLATGGIVTETHRGTRQQFSLNFVRKGLLPEEFGAVLGRLMNDREIAEYGVWELPPATVRRDAALAVEFLPAVARLVAQRDAASAEAAAWVEREAASLGAALDSQG